VRWRLCRLEQRLTRENSLERGLKVKEYELRKRNFSATGNVRLLCSSCWSLMLATVRLRHPGKSQMRAAGHGITHRAGAYRSAAQVRPGNRHFRNGLRSWPTLISTRADVSQYAVMARPGYRVARRKRAKASVGPAHKVTKEDSMAWFKQRFDGILTK
jgi:large subunit ribosomal protein L11e